MTLLDLHLEILRAKQTSELVFTVGGERIGPGFHVTELKALAINSIDCGGNTASWSETAVQLLDGEHGERMQAGKFAKILERSLQSLPALAEGDLHVEFSPQNQDLRRFEIASIKTDPAEMVVELADTRAACKPAQSGACGPNCGTAKEEKNACCG